LYYYDITGPQYKADLHLSARLGFRSILSAGADISAQDVDTAKGKNKAIMAYGHDNALLLSHVRSSARAIAPLDLHVDRRLLEEMRVNETILCIPLLPILSSYGTVRSKRIYQARLLVDNARSRRIPMAIITLATKSEYLCSAMQLLMLARMLDLSDAEAKEALSVAGNVVVTS
jgi:hypothetical protein